jgi:hypothetical protein
MRHIIDNAIRNVKDFFVESIPDFGLEVQAAGPHRGDALFDQGSLTPLASQRQPSNQEAVLNALARATELYFVGNVAPLIRNVPNLRWQIKQLQIRETTDNMHVLAELNKLSPSILNTVSKAVLCKLPCAHAMDMSRYYGLSIVPDAELVGRSVIMWANVGQDKTAMHFYFDDEIFESDEQPPAAAGEPARPSFFNAADSFHLRLIDEHGERAVAIASLPAIIGSAPNADVQVSGSYVSKQHLVLNWDAVLQCVYLTDRSKHGTYLPGGRKLADGERVNLLGDGYFTLTNQPHAPRFEYWHGMTQGQGTALLPMEFREIAPRSRNSPLTDVDVPGKPTSPAKAMPPATVQVKPPDAAKTHFEVAGSTANGQLGGAQPTLLTTPGKPGPLAWLQVRNAQGHTNTVAVTKLPFSIGREFAGDGFPIDESHIKVARTHLRLLEQRGAGFGVTNESLQRPGQSNLTYGEKGAVGRQFVWLPQSENSKTGWCVLGANRLDSESVEVRLLAANGSEGVRT